MTKAEQGLGTVRAVRDRKTGAVLGYQAYLPRELSTPPAGCANPKDYKEPLGPRQESEADARRLLAAAIDELRNPRLVRNGLPVAHYVQAEIQARLQNARRKYSAARANRLVSTWRSIERLWLSKSDFYALPPAHVRPSDVQAFFDHLRDEAEGKNGEPLSGDFIRNVARLTKAAFARAPGLEVNPAGALKLPPKGEPRVPFLDLSAQRRMFAATYDEEGELRIGLSDRTMVGCGMGAALRVGELLSLEAEDVRLDDADPHLLVRYGGPDRSPTKSGRVRRVELFEPGLGFWRLWMARFYRGGRLVFEGPRGGYLKHWPERFPGWAEVAGVRHLSSHIMRHTYAVAMLSGTWGYAPKSLEFVQQQLGHSERSTTERFYGAYEVGTWQREVRAMTGRVAEIRREPITATELLGPDLAGSAGAAEGNGADAAPSGSAVAGSAQLAESGSSSGAHAGASRARSQPVFQATGTDDVDPRRSPKGPYLSTENALAGASAHQAIERAESVLRRIADGEDSQTVRRELIDALGATLSALRRVVADHMAEAEADVG